MSNPSRQARRANEKEAEKRAKHAEGLRIRNAAEAAAQEAAQDATTGAPMSGAKKAAVVVAVLAALGGAYKAGKKAERAPSPEATPRPAAPVRSAASVPETWKGPLTVEDPAKFVRGFSLAVPGVTGNPEVLAAPEDAKIALVIVPQRHKDVLSDMPAALEYAQEVASAQKHVGATLEKLADMGVAAVQYEAYSESSVAEPQKAGADRFYRLNFVEYVQGLRGEGPKMEACRAQAVADARTAYGAIGMATPVYANGSIQERNARLIAQTQAQSPFLRAARLPKSATPAEVAYAYRELRGRRQEVETSVRIMENSFGPADQGTIEAARSVLSVLRGDDERDRLLAEGPAGEGLSWYLGAAHRLFFQGKIGPKSSTGSARRRPSDRRRTRKGSGTFSRWCSGVNTTGCRPSGNGTEPPPTRA